MEHDFLDHLLVQQIILTINIRHNLIAVYGQQQQQHFKQMEVNVSQKFFCLFCTEFFVFSHFTTVLNSSRYFSFCSPEKNLHIHYRNKNATTIQRNAEKSAWVLTRTSNKTFFALCLCKQNLCKHLVLFHLCSEHGVNERFFINTKKCLPIFLDFLRSLFTIKNIKWA